MSDMLEFRHVPHFYIYTPPAPDLNVGHRKQQLNLCTPTLKSGGQGDFILYSTARACKCCLIATVNRVVVGVVAVVFSTLLPLLEAGSPNRGGHALPDSLVITAFSLWRLQPNIK